MPALIALAIFVCASISYSSSALGNSLAKAFANNARTSIDISARGIHSQSQNSSLQAIGLDLHKVVSNESGDLGTFVFQPYLLRLDSPTVKSDLFEDNHDWALQWRIANFNYTGLGRGRFNLRIGHFEVPFGLEQVIQTNGTLKQIRSPTGPKTDWGTSINGTFPQFEYELAYMLGSGNEWDADSTGVVVGRIGTPKDHHWWLAISYLDGEYQASGSALERDRIGVDLGIQLPFGFSILSEQVLGHESNQHFRHTFVELNWRNASEAKHWFAQWREKREVISGVKQDFQSLSLGLRFEPNNQWSLSLMAASSFNTSYSNHANQFVAQIRYRTRGFVI